VSVLRRPPIRRDDGGGVLYVVLAVVAVALVALAVLYVSHAMATEDEFVPVLELTLCRRTSSMDYYRAETDLDVESPSFLEYWYSASVSGPDFPDGSHVLKVGIVYEWFNEAGERETGVGAAKAWKKVGVHQDPDASEVTYKIRFPELKKPPEHERNENVVFWVYVKWDASELCRQRYVVNFDLMEVNKG